MIREIFKALRDDRDGNNSVKAPLLNGLFRQEPGVAILAGAGISVPSPSRMLGGRAFMEHILSRTTPEWIDRKILMSTIDLPKDRYRRPGELLRFEVLMHHLAQSGLDPELRVLDCLDSCDRPTEYHYILANLIRSGAVVVTTNFDRLIEIAYAQTAVPGEVPLRVAFADADFAADVPNPLETPILWKLHGSISVAGEDTRKSVQATLTSILSTTMNRNKQAFLEEVLRRWDLFVIGYSGWDDLDIVPVLANTVSEKRLIWVDHETHRRKFHRKMANEVSTGLGWEDDVVARDRVFFNRDDEGRIIRADDKLLLLRYDSLTVARKLRQTFAGKFRSPEVQEDFQWNPEDYFDRWASLLSARELQRCEFVTEILSVNPRKHARETRARAFQRIRQMQARTLFPEKGSSETPHEAFRRLSQNPSGIRLADGDSTAQLDALIDLFNYLNESEATSRDTFVNLMDTTNALMPSLPADEKASGFKLLACIAAQIGDSAGSEIMFRWAADLSKSQNDSATELAVLRSWRSFVGFYVFPEVLSRRIVELVEELGFFPLLWRDEASKFEHFIDEHSEDLFSLARKFARMVRYSIDVGDVLGEAKGRLLEGRVCLIIAQHNDMQGVGEKAMKRAIEEFIRVQELDKLLGTGKMTSDSIFFLNASRQFGWRPYEERIRPHLVKSMWK